MLSSLAERRARWRRGLRPANAMSESTPNVERCEEHRCCLLAHSVEAEPGSPYLAGAWHLEWMSDDSAWFLVPPHGNVFEIRVLGGADPAGELAVEGVSFDVIREEIER